MPKGTYDDPMGVGVSYERGTPVTRNISQDAADEILPSLAKEAL